MMCSLSPARGIADDRQIGQAKTDRLDQITASKATRRIKPGFIKHGSWHRYAAMHIDWFVKLPKDDSADVAGIVTANLS